MEDNEEPGRDADRDQAAPRKRTASSARLHVLRDSPPDALQSGDVEGVPAPADPRDFAMLMVEQPRPRVASLRRVIKIGPSTLTAEVREDAKLDAREVFERYTSDGAKDSGAGDMHIRDATDLQRKAVWGKIGPAVDAIAFGPPEMWVFCAKGRTRSPIVAACYLLTHCDMDAARAKDTVVKAMTQRVPNWTSTANYATFVSWVDAYDPPARPPVLAPAALAAAAAAAAAPATPPASRKTAGSRPK